MKIQQLKFRNDKNLRVDGAVYSSSCKVFNDPLFELTKVKLMCPVFGVKVFSRPRGIRKIATDWRY